MPLEAAILPYDGFDSTLYKAVQAPTGGYKDPTQGPSNALFYDSDSTRNNGAVEVGQGPAVQGFTGTWNYTANISPSVYARLENSQLSYPGLTTTTGQLNLMRSAGSSSTSKGFTRDLNVGPSTGFNDVLYIAGLIQRTSGTSFTLNLASTDGSSSRPFSFEIQPDGTIKLTGNGVAALTSTEAHWDTAAHYFVLKLENSVADGGTSTTSGDRMSLFIDPDLANEGLNQPVMVLDSAVADFFVSGKKDWTLGGFQIRSNLAEPGHSVIFDEFKIVTQWSDLAIIPEPGAAILAAASLLWIGGCRRRP